MAISYPGISYLKGYDKPDVFGKFAQGFNWGDDLRQEREAPEAFAQGLPPLQEFGLPDAETLKEMFRNENTRPLAIAQVQEAQQRRADSLDPLKKLQLRKAQYDVDHLGYQAPTAAMQEFQLASKDPKFAEFIGSRGANKAPADVQEYLWYRENEKAAGRVPMEYLPFLQAQKASGLSVQTNPDGTVSITQGGTGSMPKLTEQQSKDVVYYTRGSGALPTLDEFGDALTNPIERAAGADPTGVIRQMQSDDFQQADQAGREFLQAILRKDTGAAITSQEMDSYGKTYLPVPGDGEAVLTQKKAARKRALRALKAGIPAAAILAMEQQGVVLPDDAGPSDLPPDVTEEDIQTTMKAHGMTRDQVLGLLNGGP